MGKKSSSEGGIMMGNMVMGGRLSNGQEMKRSNERLIGVRMWGQRTGDVRKMN